jgi:hypothetical protein
VLWDSKPVSLTLDEYMSNVDERQQARKRDMTEPRSELARAKQFLKEQLKDGQVPSKLVSRDAAENLISKRTLRRAREALKCVATKNGEWCWRLPESDGQSPSSV